MKIIKLISIIFFISILIVPAMFPEAGSQGKRMILTNCNVIDCTGAPEKKNVTVVIEGNRIVKIQKGQFKMKSDDGKPRVIDLEGAYVLPGLWNMHVHLSDLLPDVNNILGGENVIPAAIRAGRNAIDALKAGFTSLRVVGEPNYIDIAWRDAFDRGVFVGPRIFAAGKIVTPSQGDPWHAVWPVEVFADGPNEIRKEMRKNINHGIDFVKIFAAHLDKDEFEAAISTAHKYGLKVTADSGGKNAHRAVEAGVDCLEHGSMISDETIKLMVKKGTFLCPTVICNLSEKYIKERDARLDELGYSGDEETIEGRLLVVKADERPHKVAERHRDIIVKAAKAGVKILSGGDSNPLDDCGILEIEQLYLSGLTAMQSLQAATKNCAEWCGVLDHLGTIEEGKIADLIVVSENPLKNISNLRKLKMVLKDGKPVRLSSDEGESSFWNLFFKQDKF